MHMFNAWLPPPVAAESKKEAKSFTEVVNSIKELWHPDDPDSVFPTLKFVSIIDVFLKAKSEVSLEDVDALVLVGFDLFQASQSKLYAQVRWGYILIRLLRKYKRKLSVKVQWRPLYDCLIKTHFKRNTGPEGWKLKQQHFETLTCLIQYSRKLFPQRSAHEIWEEFRSLLENPWHNSSFEGVGFVKLFLPMNLENEEFFTMDWIKECIDIWESVPNCQFWDTQWASVISRCIRSYKSFDWECFLPELFTKFLNMFEVPVASGNSYNPFSLEVPRITRFLFSNKTGTRQKAIAISIVHLLKSGSSAQEYFEKLADLLEQFYHPSNGGHWTYSLEHFMRYLVIAFQKRLKREQSSTSDSKVHELGKTERACFVKSLLKLIDRGQYSKNEALTETVAFAISVLSYVEPALILPFVTSRFHLALETDTATHQLKAAITSVAFTTRPLFFALLSHSSCDYNISSDTINDLFSISISNALLGMDANDPPKTLATMQLLGSVFSNLPIISDIDQQSIISINFSEWLDEFLSRLFSLLLHLEPKSVLTDGAQTSTTSRTFLLDGNYHYFCMLEILLGKLSFPLYMQALKRISKFVGMNVLPGAAAEVGVLCCACVSADPEEASRHLIEPILSSLVSFLNESPISGYGGKGLSDSKFSPKAMLSPALETSIEYHLKILSSAISYAGPILLAYRDELIGAIASAFEAPSWKVNVAADNLLQALLGSLVLYYPIEQYKCFKQHSIAVGLEEWVVISKTDEEEDIQMRPTWHVPSSGEVIFANELMRFHLTSGLNDLLRICNTKVHSEAGNEKDHLKVTLLRIFSSLRGVLSCLPDLCPSIKLGKNIDDYYLISGSIGASVGSLELREKAAREIHLACRYLLNERSDDSVLLMLMIQIIDAVGNVGSLESQDLANHKQICKVESAALVERAFNFIVSSPNMGKKRPRWALIDKVFMHNTWRSAQSLYNKYRVDSNLSPPDLLIPLVDDLLLLSLHRYETIRSTASESLLKIIKRWPSLKTNCILTLMDKLSDPNTPEHVVLGSCGILSSQTVLRHLTKDSRAFSSFTLGVLASSHHDSLKAQKIITELFIKYNVHFSGLPRSFFRDSTGYLDSPGLVDLFSHVSSISFHPNNLHWRYNLMADRVLLLLTLSSRNNSNISPELLSKINRHFLRNLQSELPQLRMLAVSALNSLLTGYSYRSTSKEQEQQCSEFPNDQDDHTLPLDLDGMFEQEDFFKKSLISLSHVHVIADTDNMSINGSHGLLQSAAEKVMSFFYFDFSAAWPRTPSFISLLGRDSFYSDFARIFKRLVQECGISVVLALQSILEEFSNSTERSKQSVAAEVVAGILHSDISALPVVWESWLMAMLQKIITASSLESTPEWAACIRYAVTGKGKCGIRTPVLRSKILDCLLCPLPKTASTNVVTKRYTLLLVTFIEISPTRMSIQELQYHNQFMEELLDNMSHSSAQVREVVGIALSVLCSNLRRFRLFSCVGVNVESNISMIDSPVQDKWIERLIYRSSEIAANIQKSNQIAKFQLSADLSNENDFQSNELKLDINRIETTLHFIISSLKSGRSSLLLDVIIELLYPVFSLQETSHKDLQILAKAAFELLKWRVFPRAYLEKLISSLSSFICDPNWKIRFTCLSYLRAFMYRHAFIFSAEEKSEIWKSIEALLLDNQIEVREHAAGVLASFAKGGDASLANSFRDRAFSVAMSMHKKRTKRNWKSGHSLASIHGAVLALAASVLSSPYDMPSWLPEHVTLLARFVSEPSPVKTTVTKAVAEFRRTHADTWLVQKSLFTEDQLEVLADTSSSSSYFA